MRVWTETIEKNVKKKQKQQCKRKRGGKVRGDALCPGTETGFWRKFDSPRVFEKKNIISLCKKPKKKNYIKQVSARIFIFIHAWL